MLTEVAELREFHDFGFVCLGLFAKVDIPANTLVWQNEVPEIPPEECLTKREILEHPARDALIRFSYMVGDDCFDTTLDPLSDGGWYFNHSCDPTVWFVADDKIVTRRDVKKGEQLCYDYAATETESSLHYGMVCQCGAKNCRGKLTFSEWRSRAFVQANKGHLTSFIMRKHLENGWYDPRVELLHKSDGHFGLFCRQNSEFNFLAGQIVLIFSGKIVHRNEMTKPGALTQRELNMSLQIGKELWQVPALSENNGKPIWETSDFLNHSCDPNCGMKDSVTVVAIRDIYPGEELTIDYAMVNDGSSKNPSDNFECLCGSSNCRGRITTSDWEIPEIQARYGQFFSPFVKKLVKSQIIVDSLNNNA